MVAVAKLDVTVISAPVDGLSTHFEHGGGEAESLELERQCQANWPRPDNANVRGKLGGGGFG